MAEAGITKRAYILNTVALMTLLVLTVIAAELPLIGPVSVLIAMLIAGTKAVLVALIFMHLKIANPASRIFAAIGLIWLAILIGLTIADFATRGWTTLQGSEPTAQVQSE
jgi:cytochrome c oxidase subunit 4